jgi:hypothetical protein
VLSARRAVLAHAVRASETMRRALWNSAVLAVAVLAFGVAPGCTSEPSATDLHPEGPPMIQQVRLVEVFTVAGITTRLTRTVFGFGSYPDATADEAHPVTTAQATPNKLRIIMDELLRGNNLEEIACRAPIDPADGVFDRVPLGATPDDIARCSTAQDVLPLRCPGSNKLSLCLCRIEAGCPLTSNPGGVIVPFGDPVGVKDNDQDGAADEHRFIPGAVGISCNGIDVPLNPVLSYWTPSGDQQVPAQGGFDALGPAVVLVPQVALPTNLTCHVTFSPEVVDKDGIEVCAPAGGDRAAGCTPGDTTAFAFTVEPLTLIPIDLLTGAKRDIKFRIRANAPLDVASVAGVTVTEAPGTPYPEIKATLTMPNEITVQSTAAGGFAASTAYTISVPMTVTDTFHQPAPQPVQITFTTGPI